MKEDEHYVACVNEETYKRLSEIAEKRGSEITEVLEEILTKHKKRGNLVVFGKFPKYIIPLTAKSYADLNEMKKYYGAKYNEIIEFALENMEVEDGNNNYTGNDKNKKTCPAV